MDKFYKLHKTQKNVMMLLVTTRSTFTFKILLPAAPLYFLAVDSLIAFSCDIFCNVSSEENRIISSYYCHYYYYYYYY